MTRNVYHIQYTITQQQKFKSIFVSSSTFVLHSTSMILWFIFGIFLSYLHDITVSKVCLSVCVVLHLKEFDGWGWMKN